MKKIEDFIYDVSLSVQTTAGIETFDLKLDDEQFESLTNAIESMKGSIKIPTSETPHACRVLNIAHVIGVSMTFHNLKDFLDLCAEALKNN